MKPEFLLALALFAGAPAPALAGKDCVELVEHSIGEPDAGYGIVEIEWEARIRNRCEAAYYATLTLDFLDADGETLHQSQTHSVIEPGPAVIITKLAMLDADQTRRFTNTRVSVDGQALP